MIHASNYVGAGHRLQVCRLSAVIPVLSKAFLLYVSLSPLSVSCSFIFQLVFSHSHLAKDSALVMHHGTLMAIT
jgi:hypothetical protein